MKYRITNYAPSGQTLIETLMALAIFSFIAATLAAMVLGGMHGVSQGGEHTQADALAQEGIEAVVDIRNRAWNELHFLQSGLSSSNNVWSFTGEGTQDVFSPFTRQIVLSAVCRSQTNSIVACPGLYTDSLTKLVTSLVTWTTRDGVQNSVQRSAYMSDWNSHYWTQTDWSGGGGQTTWADATKYDSDDGHVVNVSAGQVQLRTDPSSNVWSAVSSPVTSDIKDVSRVSSSDLWAIGDNGKILHYNGVEWSLFTTINNIDLNSISMASATDGWTVGESGKIYRYNGSNWSLFTDTGSNTLNTVFMISPTFGWIVGNNGEIDRFNGTSWTNVSSPVSQQLNAVYALSTTDAWIVGDSGKILHYDGASWTETIDMGGNNIESLSFFSSTDGWAGGQNGSIFRYNGASWTLFTSIGNQVWRGFFMTQSTDGWIVGTGGEIRRWNGVAWNTVASPTTKNLFSVKFNTQTDGWAVGANGTILHFAPTGGSMYFTSGLVTSSAFLMGDASPVQEIEWDAVTPSCVGTCDVRFQIRTAPDASGVPGVWTSWQGVGGSDTYFIQGSGSLIPQEVNGNWWVQYRAFLRGDGAHTPTLQEVRVDYK